MSSLAALSSFGGGLPSSSVTGDTKTDNRTIIFNGPSGGAMGELGTILQHVMGPKENGGFFGDIMGESRYSSSLVSAKPSIDFRNPILWIAGAALLLVLFTKKGGSSSVAAPSNAAPPAASSGGSAT